MKFVAYENERYLVIQTKYRSLCFLLTSTARCHNHRKLVASCIMGTQHYLSFLSNQKDLIFHLRFHIQFHTLCRLPQKTNSLN